MTQVKTAKVGVMIDIETLSLKTGAVVWEAAMISFPLDDPETHVREFEIFLPIQPQLDLLQPRKIDAQTLGYWMKKPEAARLRILNAIEGNYDDLAAFLRRLVREFEAMTEGLEKDEYITICKGLNFDIPVLVSLFDSFGIEAPWHYQTLHCLRSTMRDAGLDQYSIPFPENLVQHQALADCVHQINLWTAAQKMIATGRV